jgi:hypothetical protein
LYKVEEMRWLEKNNKRCNQDGWRRVWRLGRDGWRGALFSGPVEDRKVELEMEFRVRHVRIRGDNPHRRGGGRGGGGIDSLYEGFCAMWPPSPVWQEANYRRQPTTFTPGPGTTDNKSCLLLSPDLNPKPGFPPPSPPQRFLLTEPDTPCDLSLLPFSQKGNHTSSSQTQKPIL